MNGFASASAPKQPTISGLAEAPSVVVEPHITAMMSDGLAHASNVAWLAGRLCESLALEPSLREGIVRSAYSHDIGKSLLPLALLEKPGPLTAAERFAMMKHVAHGASLLTLMAQHDAADLSVEIETALLHHERWDGSGYPRGLAGKEIPLPSRIVAVVDVYDALVSVRSYKPAWSHASATTLIRESSGSHFDPRCAAAFLELADDLPSDWCEQAQAQSPALRSKSVGPKSRFRDARTPCVDALYATHCLGSSPRGREHRS